jgi:hypothetical protein
MKEDNASLMVFIEVARAFTEVEMERVHDGGKKQTD